MELFGLVVPVWALILGSYIIGMPLIGYPKGKYSLMSWKYPSEWPILGMILFPINGIDDTIGEYHPCPDRDGGGSNLPTTMSMFNVHSALQDNDRLPLAKYLVFQMLIWPLAVLTLVRGVFISAVVLVVNVPTFGAKYLVRCKRCLKI